MSRSELSDNEIEIVKEALRHTELQLKGLEDLASNADRRTMSFFAGGMGFAALLVASSQFLPSMEANLIGACISILASTIAVFSILPKRFHILGHRWEDWRGHVEERDALADVLISQAEENDQRILHNFSVLERSASRFKAAVILLVLAASVAVAGQLIGYFCSLEASNKFVSVDCKDVSQSQGEGNEK